MEFYNATLASKLDAYEIILAKQKYLAGDVSLLYFFFLSGFPASLCVLMFVWKTDAISLDACIGSDTGGFVPFALWPFHNPGKGSTPNEFNSL